MSLNTLFERERNRFWTKLGAVAETHPALRSLLSRDGDARVAYLVETAAYGIARMREVLSDDAPQETHPIVGTALPETIRPTPSMTVVQWTPSESLRAAGAMLDENQEMRSIVVDGDVCEFRTLWSAKASPLTVSKATVGAEQSGSHTLRLRLAIDAGVPAVVAFGPSLRLFLRAEDPLVALNLTARVCTNSGVSVRALDQEGNTLASFESPSIAFRMPMLTEQTPLLPGRADAFPSQSLLRTYFALPEAFAFVDVVGLGELLPAADPTVRSIEIAVVLPGPAPDHERSVRFELHCTLAANVRDATFEPLTFESAGKRQRLAPRWLKDVELFEIERLQIRANQPGFEPTDLPMWHFDDGHVLGPNALVGRLHRRPATAGGGTECDLELVALSGEPLKGAQEVTVRATVTDAARTGRLLPGEITSKSAAGTCENITRVTSSIPVSMDRQVPWRMNAYARISARDFATPRAMCGFLDVLDVTGARARNNSEPATRGIERVSRTDFERIDRDAVHGGEQADVMLQPEALGGRGAASVIGEVLARALAERTDVLRFSRLRWTTRDGSVVLDYGARRGERWPFPFG